MVAEPLPGEAQRTTAPQMMEFRTEIPALPGGKQLGDLRQVTQPC